MSPSPSRRNRKPGKQRPVSSDDLRAILTNQGDALEPTPLSRTAFQPNESQQAETILKLISPKSNFGKKLGRTKKSVQAAKRLHSKVADYLEKHGKNDVRGQLAAFKEVAKACESGANSCNKSFGKFLNAHWDAPEHFMQCVLFICKEQAKYIKHNVDNNVNTSEELDKRVLESRNSMGRLHELGLPVKETHTALKELSIDYALTVFSEAKGAIASGYWLDAETALKRTQRIIPDEYLSEPQGFEISLRCFQVYDALTIALPTQEAKYERDAQRVATQIDEQSRSLLAEDQYPHKRELLAQIIHWNDRRIWGDQLRAADLFVKLADDHISLLDEKDGEDANTLATAHASAGRLCVGKGQCYLAIERLQEADALYERSANYKVFRRSTVLSDLNLCHLQLASGESDREQKSKHLAYAKHASLRASNVFRLGENMPAVPAFQLGWNIALTCYKQGQPEPAELALDSCFPGALDQMSTTEIDQFLPIATDVIGGLLSVSDFERAEKILQFALERIPKGSAVDWKTEASLRSQEMQIAKRAGSGDAARAALLGRAILGDASKRKLHAHPSTMRVMHDVVNIHMSLENPDRAIQVIEGFREGIVPEDEKSFWQVECFLRHHQVRSGMFEKAQQGSAANPLNEVQLEADDQVLYHRNHANLHFSLRSYEVARDHSLAAFQLLQEEFPFPDASQTQVAFAYAEIVLPVIHAGDFSSAESMIGELRGMERSAGALFLSKRIHLEAEYLVAQGEDGQELLNEFELYAYRDTDFPKAKTILDDPSLLISLARVTNQMKSYQNSSQLLTRASALLRLRPFIPVQQVLHYTQSLSEVPDYVLSEEASELLSWKDLAKSLQDRVEEYNNRVIAKLFMGEKLFQE